MTLVTFNPSTHECHICPHVRNEMSACLNTVWMAPSRRNWAMAASIRGKPVLPRPHLAKALGSLGKALTLYLHLQRV